MDEKKTFWAVIAGTVVSFILAFPFMKKFTEWGTKKIMEIKWKK